MQTSAPKCSKCDGAGRLSWTRVANGVCFWCEGTGRIEGVAPPAAKDALAAQAGYDLSALAQNLAEGGSNATWHAWIARRAASSLLALGDTARARGILTQIVVWGRARCDGYDEPAARRARDLVIAAGRELRAEREAA